MVGRTARQPPLPTAETRQNIAGSADATRTANQKKFDSERVAQQTTLKAIESEVLTKASILPAVFGISFASSSKKLIEMLTADAASGSYMPRYGTATKS